MRVVIRVLAPLVVLVGCSPRPVSPSLPLVAGSRVIRHLSWWPDDWEPPWESRYTLVQVRGQTALLRDGDELALFDLGKRTVLANFVAPDPVGALSLGREDDASVVVAMAGGIHQIQLDTGDSTVLLAEVQSAASDFAWTREGRLVYLDTHARTLDLDAATPAEPFPFEGPGDAERVTRPYFFSPDRSRLARFERDSLVLWDAGGEWALPLIEGTYLGTEHIEWHPSGRYLAYLESDKAGLWGACTIVDIDRRRRISTMAFFSRTCGPWVPMR